MKKVFILTGLSIVFCFVSINASAEVWTDWWWNPAESGWGVNIGNHYDTIFVAFFVYGPSGDAKWYSGGASLTGQTNEQGYRPFSGDLYETQGPFFGSAFDPNSVQRRKVGTFTFSPSSFGTAAVTYSVDGVTVTKQIERFTIRHIPLGGTYWATVAVTSDNCSLLADPGTLLWLGDLKITETGNSGVTGSITIDFIDYNLEPCQFTGSYRQYGSTYSIEGTDTCIIGSPGQMMFTEVKTSDEGISGKLVIEDIEDNTCSTEMRFSAVRE